MKTYKFRLYPNKEIEQKMFNTLELCRQTYNFCLEELNNQKVIDKSQIQGMLPDLKICKQEICRESQPHCRICGKTLYFCPLCGTELVNYIETKGKFKGIQKYSFVCPKGCMKGKVMSIG